MSSDEADSGRVAADRQAAASAAASPDAAPPDGASPDAASSGATWPDSASPDAASPGTTWPDGASSAVVSASALPVAASPDAASPDAASPDAALSVTAPPAPTLGATSSRTAVALRDEDVVLRGFVPSDLAAVLAAFADAEITAWNPGPADVSDEAALAWLTGRADWSSGGHASWAISDPDGTLLGSVSLFQLDSDQRDGEIGYWLVPAARGRGIASRAVRLAAAFGFDQLAVRRLTLFHAVANPASCRVAIAAGFRLEGTLRESHRYGDGTYHDEHVHGRLATDPLPAR